MKLTDLSLKIQNEVDDNDTINDTIQDELVKECEKSASKYDVLYHCTNIEAFMSIIENREFWLSSLNDVNDKKEIETIHDDDFKDKFFVSCFTYDRNIDKEHWKEYGENGILFSVKKKWFNNKLYGLYTDGKREVIYESHKTATHAMQLQKPGEYFFSVGYNKFLEILYDDDLYIEMKKLFMLGAVAVINPNVGGIIKKTEGVSKREIKNEYEKKWDKEKEVRLRVVINSCKGSDTKVPFKKVVIKLMDDAFDEMEIKFSPNVSSDKKNEVKKKIYKILPNITLNDITLNDIK